MTLPRTTTFPHSPLPPHQVHMFNDSNDNLHYFVAEINYVGGQMHRIDSPSEIVFNNVPPHMSPTAGGLFGFSNSALRVAAEINQVQGGVTRERSESRMTVSYANAHPAPQANQYPHPNVTPVQRQTRHSLVINRGSARSGGYGNRAFSSGDYSGHYTDGRHYQGFDGQRERDSRYPRSPYSGDYHNGHSSASAVPLRTHGNNYRDSNAPGNRRGYSGDAKARPTPYDRSNRRRGDNFDSSYYNSNGSNMGKVPKPFVEDSEEAKVVPGLQTAINLNVADRRKSRGQDKF
ncbi:hypothetical protein B0H16DRAFT_1519622 [Mycena metata]|uniref:Uncharacterized protein n=1 Tax=Mycena metata TaxID=1033252 RepID=A0AAD7JR22_9AGAR|nr:hypothetical protein B0H16DRAFT_1519622 [Mycena metata]